MRDAGSLNGTFVNGRRVLAATATRLHAGDELRFADLRFRFVSGPAGQSHTPLTTKSAPPLPSLDRADLVSHPDRLRFDDVTAEVYVGAGRAALAPKEYALLRVLWRRAGHVCSKECLAQAVWPEYQGIVSDASIESTVSRLRRKLAAAGGCRAWVQTVPRRAIAWSVTMSKFRRPCAAAGCRPPPLELAPPERQGGGQSTSLSS